VRDASCVAGTREAARPLRFAAGVVVVRVDGAVRVFVGLRVETGGRVFAAARGFAAVRGFAAKRVFAAERDFAAPRRFAAERDFSAARVLVAERDFAAARVLVAERDFSAARVLVAERDFAAARVLVAERDFSAARVLVAERAFAAARVFAALRVGPAERDAALPRLAPRAGRPGGLVGLRLFTSVRYRVRVPVVPVRAAVRPDRTHGEYTGLQTMQTSARPRTLVLVFTPDATEAALLGPTGIELGARHVVERDAERPTRIDDLWPTIEQLGEFDRITAVGPDDAAVAADISRQSQRPTRPMTLADLRWGHVVSRRGVELALSLDAQLSSDLFHDGRHVPGLAIGRQRFRKGKTFREYLAPRVLEKKGARAWSRRVARAVDELLAVWNPSTLYLAVADGAPMPRLPDNVVTVPLRLALEPAVELWSS
jgi:hypothetical protein